MLHQPIQLLNVELFFTNKTCFQEFTQNIYAGSRIGIIGQNGSGKTTLLKIIQGILQPTEGKVIIPAEVNFGYVPQIILEHDLLSGAERFNKEFTKALVLQPTVLCLDEPTNHLDQKQHKSLLKLLQRYSGTLIIVTHDLALLHVCVNEIWHINANSINCFTGSYDDYIAAYDVHKEKLETKLKQLKHAKKQAHIDLMQEQKRAKNKKLYGKMKYGKDGCGVKAVANQKQNEAEIALGKNTKAIANAKVEVLSELSKYKRPEILEPTFNLTSADYSPSKSLVYIQDGACGYSIGKEINYIVRDIQLHIFGGQHVAIRGDNASGKSTFIKAILHNLSIIKNGVWKIIKITDIGYLDQHYKTLTLTYTVLDVILQVRSDWNIVEARRHLHTFLFRTNEEIHSTVNILSGGEKVRLSLAQIAALTPKLIILDEVTNNLDLITREHVIQVLAAYPGAILVISHDEDFLKRIRIDQYYAIIEGKLILEL